MEINTKKQLLGYLGTYYKCVANPDRQLKLNLLHDKMGDRDFYFYRLWEDITSKSWYDGFPSWDQCKHLFTDNEHVQNPALDEFEGGKIKGRWVCRDCQGRCIHLSTIKKNGIDYKFANDCQRCSGEGRCVDREDNIFMRYIGRRAHEDFMLNFKQRLGLNKNTGVKIKK